MKSSTDTINKLCNESQIVLPREHWLYPDELSLISQLNLNFSGFGLSSMCLDDKLITGRPHGGIGILWEQDVREAMRVVFFCTYKTYLYAQNEISYENIQILF